MRTCAVCGRSIAGRRANARTCGDACRQRLSRRRSSETIPAIMRNSARWVTWKPVRRNDRVTKAPRTVSGGAASSTNPATWTDFNSVRHLVRRGWVLGNGIGCIDLDHCIVDGVVAGWAREVIEEHRSVAVLVEVSPSGDGVHIFLPMAQGSGRKIRDGRNIEIYPPDSGRYICVTGNVLK